MIELPYEISLQAEGKTTPKEKELVEEKINEILEKGFIIKVDPSPVQILSNIFTAPKKDAGNRPEIGQVYSLSSFQNGGFVSDNRTTFAKRLYVQSGSKGCLLLSSYPSEFTEEPAFPVGSSLYQLLCFCFGLYPAPLVFTKLLKVPIALLKN